MNTAEVLEAIPDRARFERLATSILRKVNKDYFSILHIGINAKGETIPAPVDGFCLVPGSIPPHFIQVQHTTTDIDRKGLEGKWLNDQVLTKKSNSKKTKSAHKHVNGDLIKAGHEAKDLRSKFPDAKFTIVLTTNQRLSIELAKKVYGKAKDLNFTCDIWEQSRLADFLDSTPEGQWLRKEHLGIEAEMLSESLLHSICKNSLSRYERELFLADSSSRVMREVDVLVKNGIKNDAYTIEFLLGESGFGKSNSSYQALQEHINSDEYGLWVPAELMSDCTSLEGMLDRVLRDIYPRLQLDVGQSALQLIKGKGKLLLIVDDINKTNAPVKLVRKLLTWLKPQSSSASHLGHSASEVFALCPVWPQVWRSIDQEFSGLPWAHTVFIGPMTSKEGAIAVQAVAKATGVEISNTEAWELATKLGNDPILIKIFGLLLSHDLFRERNALTDNVIEQFITDSVEKVSSTPNVRHVLSEYHSALSTLASCMLRNHRFHPSWEQIQEWFQAALFQLDALRELIQGSDLCQLSTPAKESRFIFRHDRIQEVLLVDQMRTLLSAGNVPEDILKEPFYAEILGQVIARHEQDATFLRTLRDTNPMALVVALKWGGTPTSEYYRQIVQELKEWVSSGLSDRSIPDSVFSEFCWALVDTDSPAALEMTDGIPDNIPILLARLRNGCAISGARFCVALGDFAPAGSFDVRDRVLEQAKSRHRNELLEQLRGMLTSPVASDSQREGALILAGFLGFPDIADEIGICWNLATDKAQVFSAAFWAAAQCCGQEPDKLIGPLLKDWVELPEKDNKHLSSKDKIAEDLCMAFARGIRKEAIMYLASRGEKSQSSRGLVQCVLERVDDPDAVEFIVRQNAEIKKKLSESGKSSPWSELLTNPWRHSGKDESKLSELSMERLLTLWQDQENEDFLKGLAFQIWVNGVEDRHLEILAAIPPDSPFFHTALVARAQLMDERITPHIATYLSADFSAETYYWFQFAHYVWCEEIRVVTEHHLQLLKDTTPTDFSRGRQNAHYALSKLFRKIPIYDAEKLLVKYWDHLGYSPPFIQTALYIGTPKCLEIADASIRQCPQDIPLFEHIGFELGFMMKNIRDYASVRHLNILLPYLDRFGERELNQLAQVCQKLGIPEWSEQYLSHRLTIEDRERYHPSNEDLFRDLDRFEADKHGLLGIRHWLEDSEKRHDQKSRILGIVDDWLSFHPTTKALKIAAQCVQRIGNREDLSILEKHDVRGPISEITKIKASARFVIDRRSLD